MKNRSAIEMSAIAELVFLTKTELNFPRITAELQRAIQGNAANGCNAGLIGGDQWWITAKGALVTLSLIRNPRRGVETSLTLSVGPIPGIQSNDTTTDHHRLAEDLLDRLQARVCADQTHWLRRSAPSAITPTIVALEPPPQLLPLKVKSTEVAAFAMLPVHLSLVPANDQPDLPSTVDFDLKRLRDALYFQDDAAMAPAVATDQMRLAVHAMNATLIIVALPVGAAMLTYSLLRGDNLRATASALVATGLGIAMLQGPALQQLLSLVG